MVIEELPDRECRTILERARFARLACSLHDQPYIVPIHVDFYDGALYGFAAMGQKIEWMRQNPLVCLEIDELIAATQWTSVVVFGAYQELPDLPAYEYQRSVAEKLFQRHPVWWEPGSVPVQGHQPHPRILFRILIDRMTGRRAAPDEPDTRFLPDQIPDRIDRPRGLAHALRRALGGR